MASLLKCFLNSDERVIDIISLEFDKKPSLVDFYDIIGCNTINIVDYDGEYGIIVDDEGPLKTRNYVYKLNSNNGSMQLAGILLFGKRVETKEGYDIVGFENEAEERIFLEKLRADDITITGYVK